MHGTALPPKMTESQIEYHLVGVVMAQQYSINKAKELFGDKADAEGTKELNQMHAFETSVPVQIKANDISREEKKKALKSLIIVTKKINGDTQVRKVVCKYKHRIYDEYDKADVSSSTLATEKVFMNGVINAKENRGK